MPGLAALYVAFALSGAAALLTEQVFEKLLSTLIGASTPASAVVLAIYFAGLTIGGLGYRRMVAARRASRFSYPALEVAVAAGCLVLATSFEALVPAFAPWLRGGEGKPALLALLRAVVAAVWILPLTIPMGATFQAITDAADRVAGGRSPRAMSILYALNLAGAIVATIGGPMVLFPLAGMSGALGFAAGLDVVAALLALLVLFRADALPTSPPREILSRPTVPPGLLAIAATTGFLLFALEVTWTHLASAVIGSSVYAFAAMLAAVLVGLGLGSAISAVVFPRTVRVPAWAPGGALLAGAMTLAAVHPLWPSVPHAVASLGSEARSFATAELARFAIALGVLVPPSAALGVAYPLLFRVPSYPDEDRGSVAGLLTAANAIGCVTGALATGFFALPRFGSETTERGLVVIAALAGATAVAASAAGRVRAVAAAACALSVVAVLVLPRWDRVKLTSGEHVYFRKQYEVDATELLSFHEDSLGGITTVEEVTVGKAKARVLFTNGKFEGSDSGEKSA